MKLYEEILLLQTFHNGYYCVENVITYYDPLIMPVESNSHYYWANFYFERKKNETRHIRGGSTQNKKLAEMFGIDLSKYKLNSMFKRKIINNCVHPKDGLHIFNSMLGIRTKLDVEQQDLFNP